MVTTPAGEQHGLSALMATTALKEAGWKVHHLGPDLPTDEILAFAEQHDIGVVVLSAATDDGRASAQSVIDDLRDRGVTALTNELGMQLSDLVAAVEAARS